MREAQTLQALIDDGTIAKALSKGSSAKHAITALQTVLHWLGFDKQLKWDKFGADGDYGGATTAAVADFAKRNGSSSAGEKVTAPLATKILARYEALEELKQLAADVAKQRTDRYYKKSGPDTIRIAALQLLLHDLGYTAELKWDKFGADGDYGGSTTKAVRAFAAREGFADNGEVLTLPLAKRIVDTLSPMYGSAWNAPDHGSTAAPGSLTVKSVIGEQNRQYLQVSDGVRTKKFRKFRLGLVTYGTQKPATFVQTNAAALKKLKITQSEINVMIAVAENEGNLDAINTWDSAFLSVGMFQWTAGTGSSPGELPALLGRIKDENRDLFDRYCGQHGLDVVDVTPDYGTGYFTLRGTKIKSPDAKKALRLAPWAFYFWRAAQDPEVQALEIKHALSRLDRFYSTRSFMVGEHLVSDLITSEYGVGLLLDNHVNRPGYVQKCLAKALKKTDLSKPAGWGDSEERTLIKAYLAIRESYGSSPMTHAAARARVTAKYVKKGIISDRRGSFKWSGS